MTLTISDIFRHDSDTASTACRLHLWLGFIVSKEEVGSDDASFFVGTSAKFPQAAGVAGLFFLQGHKSEIEISCSVNSAQQPLINVGFTCFSDADSEYAITTQDAIKLPSDFNVTAFHEYGILVDRTSTDDSGLRFYIDGGEVGRYGWGNITGPGCMRETMNVFLAIEPNQKDAAKISPDNHSMRVATIRVLEADSICSAISVPTVNNSALDSNATSTGEPGSVSLTTYGPTTAVGSDEEHNFSSFFDPEIQQDWCCNEAGSGCKECQLDDGTVVEHLWKGPGRGERWCLKCQCLNGALICPTSGASFALHDVANKKEVETSATGRADSLCPKYECNIDADAAWSGAESKFCCETRGVGCHNCILPGGSRVQHGYAGAGDTGETFCVECTCEDGVLSCPEADCRCEDDDFCSQISREACETWTIGVAAGTTFQAHELCPARCNRCTPSNPNVPQSLNCTLTEGTMTREEAKQCCLEQKVGCTGCAGGVEEGWIGIGGELGDALEEEAACKICRCEAGHLDCFGEVCDAMSGEYNRAPSLVTPSNSTNHSVSP